MAFNIPKEKKQWNKWLPYLGSEKIADIRMYILTSRKRKYCKKMLNRQKMNFV